MRFFRVLLYYTSVTLRTIKMHSGFPNKVNFILFDFFPPSYRKNALEMVQIKLVFLDLYVSASDHKLMAVFSQFKEPDKCFH